MKKMPMVKRILAAAMVIAMVATSGNMDWNLIRSKADFETAENRIASGGAFVQQIVGAGSSEYGIKRLNSLQIQVTPANSDTISSARAVIYPGVTALSQTSADSAIVWSNPAVAAVANKPDSYTITFNAETEFYLGTNEPVAVKFVVSTTNGNDIDFWTLAASTTQLPASGYFDTVGFINLDKPVCSCDLTGEELTSGSVYEQYSRVESVSLDKTDVVNVPSNTPKSREVKETSYKGPSVLSWVLDNRRALSLPIPVYKCQGGGTVTIQIIVGRNGYVKR